MRLVRTTDLTLHEFIGDVIPPYAILSHTWGDDELTFQDMLQQDDEVKAKRGYQKLLGFSREARKHHEFGWCDTCCTADSFLTTHQ